MVDAEGTLYDGDQLLFAVVRSRLRHGPVAGVVGTLMTNLALEHALAELDIPLVRADVGDRYVMDMLRQKGWLYGGENSGHILCLDRHSTGDGIVSALQVLSALRASGGTLQELLGDLKLYPQKLINVALSKGFPVAGSPLDRIGTPAGGEHAERPWPGAAARFGNRTAAAGNGRGPGFGSGHQRRRNTGCRRSYSGRVVKRARRASQEASQILKRSISPRPPPLHGRRTGDRDGSYSVHTTR
jgi:hypothetical protein